MIQLRIKVIALDKGFNQSTLSCAVNVDFKTVKRIFQNPHRDVPISTLVALAKALNITVNDLIEDVPEVVDEK